MRLSQIPKHEHVDILWGKNVHKVVIPEVLAALDMFSEKPSKTLHSASSDETAENAVYPSPPEVRVI